MADAPIDPSTGALTLDDGVGLDPSVTLEAFLASPLGQGARSGVQNHPWRSWVVDGVHIGDERFRAMICFSDGLLGMVDLVRMGPNDRPSWDASDSTERARQRGHDEWIERHLGARTSGTDVESRWQLDDCEIVSFFHERACAAGISFRFSWEKDDVDEEEM